LNENRNILIFSDNLRLSIGRGDRRNYRADGLVSGTITKNISQFENQNIKTKQKKYCTNIILYLLFSCKVIAIFENE
jgi:hypothetical protein